MIEIQPEPASHSPCPCCGRTMVNLTRFVFRDGNAHAVYCAQYTPDHEKRLVSGIIGLGEWGEGTTPDQRLAFPFELWEDADDFHVRLVNAAETPWKDVTFLGRILDREEA